MSAATIIPSGMGPLVLQCPKSVAGQLIGDTQTLSRQQTEGDAAPSIAIGGSWNAAKVSDGGSGTSETVEVGRSSGRTYPGFLSLGRFLHSTLQRSNTTTSFIAKDSIVVEAGVEREKKEGERFMCGHSLLVFDDLLQTTPQVCYEVVRFKGNRGQSGSCGGGTILGLSAHMERLRGSLLRTFFSNNNNSSSFASSPTTTATTPPAGSLEVVDSIVEAVIKAHRQLVEWNTTTTSGSASEIRKAIDQMNIRSSIWRNPPLGQAAEHHQEEMSSGDTVVHEFGFLVTFIPSSYPTAQQYAQGVEMALLHNAQRPDPNSKVAPSQNLTSRVQELKQRTGCYEVLLADPPKRRGEQEDTSSTIVVVPEGFRSNYIAITDQNVVLCSKDEQILVGVTLQLLRAACQDPENNIEFLQREITLQDLIGEGGESPSTAINAPSSGGTAFHKNNGKVVAMAMLGTSPGVLPVKCLRYFPSDFSLPASASFGDPEETEEVVHEFSVKNPLLQSLIVLYEAVAAKAGEAV